MEWRGHDNCDPMSMRSVGSRKLEKAPHDAACNAEAAFNRTGVLGKPEVQSSYLCELQVTFYDCASEHNGRKSDTMEDGR